jgi:hypothetical protein
MSSGAAVANPDRETPAPPPRRGVVRGRYAVSQAERFWKSHRDTEGTEACPTCRAALQVAQRARSEMNSTFFNAPIR